MKQINFDDIITFEKLSEKIGLSLDTIEKWREKGMPTIKIDKYIRVYWPKVLQWIVKQEEKIQTDNRQNSLFEKKGGE